jgi:TPP-dependent pyruvate/acetoin dehydrogenase alpha subunit
MGTKHAKYRESQHIWYPLTSKDYRPHNRFPSLVDKTSIRGHHSHMNAFYGCGFIVGEQVVLGAGIAISTGLRGRASTRDVTRLRGTRKVNTRLW